MKRNIELLAPGGDVDSIKAAIIAGANAIYCGLDKFNARNRAANISIDDLSGIVRLAHQYNCQIYITLNIIIVESEIPALIRLLNKLVYTQIDGVIIQDLGLLYILSLYFPSLCVHASTQLTTHNEGQIKFLNVLNVNRVNLSRELNINEIKHLTSIAHQNKMLVEVFVHGSNCLCFSGLCYMSSVYGGNSGNRGRCSQPCRDQYLATQAGLNFPLNLKDNSAFTNLRELYNAGVDSLKIEGRIKKFHYVYTVVDTWRKQLQEFGDKNIVNIDKSALYKVFNREFTNAYLTGDINKDMFIDNPRDNSAIRLSELNGCQSNENLDKAKGDIYDERTDIINSLEIKLKQLSIEKLPITISFSGKYNSFLKIIVTTPYTTFTINSEYNLTAVGTQPLTYELIMSRFKVINDTAFYIEKLDLNDLQANVYISFKALSLLKRQLLFILNGSKYSIEPIEVPLLKQNKDIQTTTSLSVLISSFNDLYICNITTISVYFLLPNQLNNNYEKYIDLFIENKTITPWFPSVLIGEDYTKAIEILEHVKPKRIVTDNTGIAYEAYKRGISWIAGPYLNTANSFTLLCLKEKFNCSGAFLSNELSRIQLKGIKKPDNFDLYYTIYQPIMLMTSRQCLFQQVEGCEKEIIDSHCISSCNKSTSITNLKSEKFFIDKTKGNYHRIFNNSNLLNINIITDIPNKFSSFFIDLSNIETDTKIIFNKIGLITHFVNLLNGNTESEQILKQGIAPSSNIQYKKGI